MQLLDPGLWGMVWQGWLFLIACAVGMGIVEQAAE